MMMPDRCPTDDLMPNQKARTALTDLGVNSLKPKKTRFETFDATVPGLAIRVAPSGRKSWTVHYRNSEGRPQRMTLDAVFAEGGDPETEDNAVRSRRELEDIAGGVAWARAKARQVREWVANDKDPKVEMVRSAAAQTRAAREATRAAATFGSLANEYIKEETPELRRGKEDEAIIRKHLVSTLEHIPVAEIRKGDVTAITNRLKARTRQYPNGRIATARRVHGLARRILRWAYATDLIDTNPIADLPAPASAAERDRILTDGEILKIWAGLEGLDYRYRAIIRLLFVTAARRSEVAGMRWNEIDGDTWRLPPERTKNAKGATVPLSPLAQEVIADVPRQPGTQLLFRTTHRTKGRTEPPDNPVSGWAKFKTQLDKASGVVGWRHHDIRRTVASRLAGAGVELPVIQTLLHHTPERVMGVTGIYVRHRFENEARAALLEWEGQLRKIVGLPQLGAGIGDETVVKLAR